MVKKIGNGWYLACPRCFELSRGDDWAYVMKYPPRAIIRVKDDGSIEEYEDPNDYIDDRDYVVVHYCDDGDDYVDETYWAEDYLIRIEDGKVVEVGSYWEDNPEDLKKLAEKNELKVKGV